jgi:hypothetical protein
MSTATRTKPKAADAPAVSPPPKTPEPVMLTAALASKARERRLAIHKFALPATAALAGVPAMEAEVRIPDLGDPELLVGLPDTLLRRILTVANEVEARGGNTNAIDLTKPDEIDLEKAKRNAKQSRALIDGYCVAGFVNPELVMTEADQKNTNQILLEDIHPADRTAFFNWCNGQHTEAAATVEPFPGGSREGVATSRSGGVDGAAAERTVEAVGSGA